MTEAPQLTQDQLFARFWQHYPRKDAKKDARKAWGQVKADADLTQRILLALDWQRRLPQWQDRQYIPLPASYLRGERWDDEMPASLQPKLTWRDECAELHGLACADHQAHWWRKVRDEQSTEPA